MIIYMFIGNREKDSHNKYIAKSLVKEVWK